MHHMPAAPDLDCLCLAPLQSEMQCACTATEKALRNWAYNAPTEPMSAEQRAWCVDQVRRHGDAAHRATSFDGEPDELLARAVLCAWRHAARGAELCDLDTIAL